MNYQLEPYQPLISRRIDFAPRRLPAASRVSRRMEFGMRNLKHRLHDKTVSNRSTPEESLPLPLLARSRSQTPIPSASRFSTHPSVSEYRQPTTKFGGNRGAKSPEPGQRRVRFEGDDSDEDDTLRNEIEREGEEGSDGKISKPPVKCLLRK